MNCLVVQKNGWVSFDLAPRWLMLLPATADHWRQLRSNEELCLNLVWVNVNCFQSWCVEVPSLPWDLLLKCQSSQEQTDGCVMWMTEGIVLVRTAWGEVFHVKLYFWDCDAVILGWRLHVDKLKMYTLEIHKSHNVKFGIQIVNWNVRSHLICSYFFYSIANRWSFAQSFNIGKKKYIIIIIMKWN